MPGRLKGSLRFAGERNNTAAAGRERTKTFVSRRAPSLFAAAAEKHRIAPKKSAAARSLGLWSS